jgi:hypothetical protein
MISGIYVKQLGLLYRKGMADDIFGSVLFGMPAGIGSLAFGVNYYNAGDIELIDTTGAERTVNAQTDILATACLGIPLGNFSAGVSVKALSSKLVESESAATIAADFGAGLKLNDSFTLGLSLQNLGGKLKYIQEGDNLPLTLRCGGYYKIIDAEMSSMILSGQALAVAADVVKTADSDKLNCNIGMEYTYNTVGGGIHIRAGYKLGYDLAGPTFGVGFTEQGFSIDYSFSSMKELNSVHCISFSYKFDETSITGSRRSRSDDYYDE